MSVSYPTNSYTTISLSVNNVTDGLIIKDNVYTNGISTLTNPTNLYSDLNSWVNRLSTNVSTYNSAVSDVGFSTTEKSFFVKSHQNTILMMRFYAMKVIRELRSLTSEITTIENHSTTSVPNNTASVYPSSKNNF